MGIVLTVYVHARIEKGEMVVRRNNGNIVVFDDYDSASRSCSGVNGRILDESKHYRVMESKLSITS